MIKPPRRDIVFAHFEEDFAGAALHGIGDDRLHQQPPPRWAGATAINKSSTSTLAARDKVKPMAQPAASVA